jgi:Zn finger protein HypA/HybF involved in hydrogenase expression
VELIASSTKNVTTVTTLTRATPQVIRCACTVCGAHTNAVKTFRLTGSCPNCGSYELSPIEGAAPLGGPIAA